MLTGVLCSSCKGLGSPDSFGTLCPLGSVGCDITSLSSVISASLRRRSELFEEDVEAEAVCKEQAADRAVSLSSAARAMVNSAS